MAYFIFLKSLRSLEEFRKNPHIKIPPKSPCANFQSLCIFENSNFIQKYFFPPIPAHPAQPRAAPARFAPPAAVCALGPLGLSNLGVFAKRRLFFEFAQSVNGVSFLSHRYQVGPTHQIHPLPRAGRPESRLHCASPQLIAPRLPASIIETPIKAPYSPALIPPLESPLTPPLGHQWHRPYISGRYSSAFPPRAAPAPYKRRAPPPSFTAPLPGPFLLSPRLRSALTEHHRRRIFTAIARPPRCSSTSGEALDRTRRAPRSSQAVATSFRGPERPSAELW
jgi:hypothetical protein